MLWAALLQMLFVEPTVPIQESLLVSRGIRIVAANLQVPNALLESGWRGDGFRIMSVVQNMALSRKVLKPVYNGDVAVIQGSQSVFEVPPVRISVALGGTGTVTVRLTHEVAVDLILHVRARRSMQCPIDVNTPDGFYRVPAASPQPDWNPLDLGMKEAPVSIFTLPVEYKCQTPLQEEPEGATRVQVARLWAARLLEVVDDPNIPWFVGAAAMQEEVETSLELVITGPARFVTVVPIQVAGFILPLTAAYPAAVRRYQDRPVSPAAVATLSLAADANGGSDSTEPSVTLQFGSVVTTEVVVRSVVLTNRMAFPINYILCVSHPSEFTVDAYEGTIEPRSLVTVRVRFCSYRPFRPSRHNFPSLAVYHMDFLSESDRARAREGVFIPPANLSPSPLLQGPVIGLDACVESMVFPAGSFRPIVFGCLATMLPETAFRASYVRSVKLLQRRVRKPAASAPICASWDAPGARRGQIVTCIHGEAVQVADLSVPQPLGPESWLECRVWPARGCLLCFCAPALPRRANE